MMRRSLAPVLAAVLAFSQGPISAAPAAAQSGEPMVLVPGDEPVSARERSRGLLSSIRRAVPTVLRDPEVVASERQAAQGARAPVVTDPAPTEAPARPVTAAAAVAPLPPARPQTPTVSAQDGSTATAAEVAAEDKASAQAEPEAVGGLEFAVQPGLPAELANERALDQAARAVMSAKTSRNKETEPAPVGADPSAPRGTGLAPIEPVSDRTFAEAGIPVPRPAAIPGNEPDAASEVAETAETLQGPPSSPVLADGVETSGVETAGAGVDAIGPQPVLADAGDATTDGHEDDAGEVQAAGHPAGSEPLVADAPTDAEPEAADAATTTELGPQVSETADLAEADPDLSEDVPGVGGGETASVTPSVDTSDSSDEGALAVTAVDAEQAYEEHVVDPSDAEVYVDELVAEIATAGMRPDAPAADAVPEQADTHQDAMHQDATHDDVGDPETGQGGDAETVAAAGVASHATEADHTPNASDTSEAHGDADHATAPGPAGPHGGTPETETQAHAGDSAHGEADSAPHQPAETSSSPHPVDVAAADAGGRVGAALAAAMTGQAVETGSHAGEADAAHDTPAADMAGHDAHEAETGAHSDQAHGTSDEAQGAKAKGDDHGVSDKDEPAPVEPLTQPSRLGSAADQVGGAIAPPYQLVRTLQTLQDNIAAGSADALNAQKVLLAQMHADLLAVDPEVWQDRRNAEALIVYTLSGGRPEVTRELLSREEAPNVDERLLRAALAYVEGRELEARKMFETIEPLDLPSSMAGQVALAKSTLMLDVDRAKSMELLDVARLLSPGTLVEEAALRREIYLASERNDIDLFERLALQYFYRFRNSVYAGNFRQRFADALTRMSFVDDPEQFDRLNRLLVDLDDADKREMYLVVARAAVNEGKTSVAAKAADAALASAEPNSRDRSRALLYRGAAMAVTPEGLETSIDDLTRVDRRVLTPSDAALFDAAAATADLILNAPEGSAMAQVDLTEDDETFPESDVVSQAASAIEAVDALLKETQ
ncbi:hypothetical protein [Amorphus orientalis]|uniref:Chemotaxis protein MotC n=1 Tax=Amorphus orientalis TaxID=649198 RepID=A0AAE4ATT2_9HYPH|nr:hypothetical protein [Amorphus orientalis]MDQ0317606.1 hypothetical protein [Amorphus orientalis]